MATLLFAAALFFRPVPIGAPELDAGHTAGGRPSPVLPDPAPVRVPPPRPPATAPAGTAAVIAPPRSPPPPAARASVTRAFVRVPVAQNAWVAIPVPWPVPAPLPAPLAAFETARYRVGFGVLSGLGEIRLDVGAARIEGQSILVSLSGFGAGSLAGFGRMSRTVDSDLDLATLAPRRWSTVRDNDGEKRVTTSAEQPWAGTIQLVRHEDGGGDERRSAALGEAALDPLGLVARLRVAPPADGETLVVSVLDGPHLWRVTIAGRGRERLPDSLSPVYGRRLEGRAEPILYDGRPDRDSDRPVRTFSLWLSDDAHRTPLLLTVPVGPGVVEIRMIDCRRQSHSTARAASQAPPRSPARL